MANEIIKEIKTRIALKYNTYEYWTTGEGKDYAPLKGEVCFCAIESKDQGAQTAPTVLFKVGIDGQTKFSALKWASALAADVYDWAKVAGANVFTKDGVGNVVSGIEYDATLNSGKGGFKFTTASVATAEGLEELQKTVAAINKTITDNSDAWNKYEDTRYSFSTDGDKLVVKKTLYTNGVAGTEEAVGTYEFLTAGEVAETLKDYYTKDEADARFAPIGIDTGVHSVSLASGTNNGTLKLTVDGAVTDNVAVTGLGSAAYVTVDSLNATAKGYADGKDGAIAEAKKAGTDAASALDAYSKLHEGDYNNSTIDGKVAAVLGTSADGAAVNTVYGAKAAAAAAQNDATIAKTKIETFLGTVTPDGSQDIIDTLAEINSYVGEHGEEFATLSGRVTNIENGTTVVPKATDADTLDGHDSLYFATAESVTDITEENGIIDTKISAYDTSKNFGDIITHDAAEFATVAQGAAADTALQSVKVLGHTLTKSANEITVAQAKTALGLGTMAYEDKDNYQGKDDSLTNFLNYWSVNDQGAFVSSNSECLAVIQDYTLGGSMFGGDYNHIINEIVLGYDNPHVRLGGYGDGYLYISNGTDTVAPTRAIEVGVEKLQFTKNDKVYNIYHPPVNTGAVIEGEQLEYVVSGSAEIVYVLDCN